MKSKFVLLVSVAAVVLVAQFAQAGILSDLSQLMFWDGKTVNKLEDVDREGAVLGADNTLDVGDYLFGVWRIDFVEDVDPSSGGQIYPTTRTITAVFAVQVAAKKTQEDGGIAYGFNPIADNTTFDTLTDRSGAGASGRTSSNTIAMVYLEDFDGSPPPPFGANPAMKDVGDTGDNASEIYEWGFAPVTYDTNQDNLGVDSLTYFWVADATTDDFTAVSIGSVLYAASMAMLDRASEAFELLPHNYLKGITRDDFTFPDVSTQVQLLGQTDGQFDSTKTLQVPTDTDIFIKPLPEPSSLVGLASALLAGTFVWRRRRKR